MSAWPQAVWIINKIEQKENLREKIDNYEGTFGALEDRLQESETSLSDLETKIQNIIQSAGIIVEPANQDLISASEGMIWFVYQGNENSSSENQENQEQNEEEETLLTPFQNSEEEGG